MQKQEQETEEDSKLICGIRHLQAMKRDKKRGRVTLYLDGSGKVNEIEIVEKK